ncbi:hypothetical protein [Roseomonas elaeocarpi]|uniref:Uncharacterized protein n=1 Tax=Roseomonas elaeocarpi TaxID=907779 RepID=A0ABV6JVJ4_9PROT
MAGLLALIALGLAGCGSNPKDPLANVPAPCPNVALLGDAADLSRYAGGREDLTTMVLDARLTGFQAKCDYAPNHAGLDVTLRLAMSAERGPAATGNTAQLPYMVAVVSADESAVLARATYTAQVEFPANVSRVQTQGEELSIRIPGGVEQARTRRVLLGFVLTPEELAVNRRRGPRG